VDIVSEFSKNPRDIKRFMNVLRFQRFLRESVIAGAERLSSPSQPIPSADQLTRWLILSLKWPGVIRWLYWSAGSYKNKDSSSQSIDNPISERLKKLERLSKEYKDDNEWHLKVKTALQLDADTVPWANDKGLWDFLTTTHPGLRLSSTAGNGLF
jgi:hypothetical protein